VYVVVIKELNHLHGVLGACICGGIASQRDERCGQKPFCAEVFFKCHGLNWGSRFRSRLWLLFLSTALGHVRKCLDLFLYGICEEVCLGLSAVCAVTPSLTVAIGLG
jgi:hypothetical protein